MASARGQAGRWSKPGSDQDPGVEVSDLTEEEQLQLAMAMSTSQKSQDSAHGANGTSALNADSVDVDALDAVPKAEVVTGPDVDRTLPANRTGQGRAHGVVANVGGRSLDPVHVGGIRLAPGTAATRQRRRSRNDGGQVFVRQQGCRPCGRRVCAAVLLAHLPNANRGWMRTRCARRGPERLPPLAVVVSTSATVGQLLQHLRAAIPALAGKRVEVTHTGARPVCSNRARPAHLTFAGLSPWRTGPRFSPGLQLKLYNVRLSDRLELSLQDAGIRNAVVTVEIA